MKDIYQKLDEVFEDLKYRDMCFFGKDEEVCLDGSTDSKTAVLFVNCNDLFGPGADGEDIALKEIPELCKMYIEDKNTAVLNWVAKKRGVPAVYWRDEK
jgi:hypothetical protein